MVLGLGLGLEFNGGWPMILKFAESTVWFSQKIIFSKAFDVFDTVTYGQFFV